MKTSTVSANKYYVCKHQNACRYPNAASRRYTIEKIVNGVLAAMITLSAVTIAVVLVTM